MNMYKDDRATGNMSFILPVFFVALIFSGVLLSFNGYAINEILKVHNNNVDGGFSSQTTADNIHTAKQLNALMGIVSVIGIVVWVKNHSKMENTNTDAYMLLSSISGIYIGSLITLFFLLMGGMMIDTTANAMNSANTMDIQNTSFGALTDTVTDTRKIADAACYLPMFMGATLFLWNSVRKTTGETIQSDVYINAGVD